MQRKNSMELNVLLFINKEADLADLWGQERITLIAAEDQQMAERICLQHREEILLLAVTDETCRLASRLQIPCAAVKLDQYPHESLMMAQMLFLDLSTVTVEDLRRVFRRFHGMPWQILETERCTVWEMSKTDLDDLYEMYETPGMGGYLEPLHKRQEEEERLEAYIRSMYGFYGFGIWIIRHKADGRLLGRAGFSIREHEGDAVLELGYAVTPQERRKGYAGEICQALLRYASEELQEYPSVIAFAEADNVPSQELLLKLGFHFWEERMDNGSRVIGFNRCNFRENSL